MSKHCKKPRSVEAIKSLLNLGMNTHIDFSENGWFGNCFKTQNVQLITGQRFSAFGSYLKCNESYSVILQTLYYKIWQKFITECDRYFITKCDATIVKCESNYKICQI